jgi:hypothetical protein
MFTTIAHSGVDAIQTAKKQIVTTFVQHDDLAKILNSFVDAQASYTKSAIDAGIKMSTDIGGILSDRTPYVQMMEKFASYSPAATSTKKSK